MAWLGQPSENTIAVVGLGCRFPGAADVDEFWANLIGNLDSVTAIPADRFDAEAHYAPLPGTPGRSVSRNGGFLEEPFVFDAGFFGISPAEARTMDPQHRILLHVVWEALEDAGIRPSSLAGSRAGVFVGQATAEYGNESWPLTEQNIHRTVGRHLRSMAAGRVSYALDLRGPSIVVDTACSSSLVAVHMARQSLLCGESDLAIAGGVNVILSPRDAIAYSQAGMLSPDGRCKFADAGADGFVRSEGVGVVVLKRLGDARRDSDKVLALLVGSAVTNDGRGSGLPLKPAISGQVEMLRAACRNAGVSPADLDYVEAHGTGTSVGDAVELNALAKAIEGQRAACQPLRTGSVKTNIGHAEAASGIAGLIKTILIAQHGVIPGSLHLRSPHPLLADAAFPVRVVAQNEPLGANGPAALGVSSFGLSGTNAHVLVAQHPPEQVAKATPAPAEAAIPHLLILSARSQGSLQQLAASYARYLHAGDPGHDLPLRDVCAAAALRRDHHPYRLWVTGATHQEVGERLEDLAAGRQILDGGMGEAGFGGDRRTVFVFPGQGSQWQGMGRRLMRAFPAFSSAIADCDAAVRAELGWSVTEELLRDSGEFATEIDVVQPVLWAMEVALAALWRNVGVEPDLCFGHSMGESAAAATAGGLSIADAARVICQRSRLMRRLTGRGAMLATELSPDEARRIAEAHPESLFVAVENSPMSTILAGDSALLREVSASLERRGRFSRFVKVTVASHSPDTDAIREDLLAALQTIRPEPPSVPMLSTVRCAPIEGAALDPEYWMANLRHPVRFAETVTAAAKEAESVFLEISPHPLLLSAMEESIAAAGMPAFVVSSLRQDMDEPSELTRALGRAYVLGVKVDWRRLFPGGVGSVKLPRYPWDGEYLREQISILPASVYVCERPLDIEAAAVSFRGVASVPQMFYVNAILQAARAAHPELSHRVEDAVIVGGLVTRAQADGMNLRVALHPEAGGHRATVEIFRDDSAAEPPRACFSARVVSTAREQFGGACGVLDAALGRCSEYLSGDRFREELRGRGYSVPAQLAAIRQLWRRDGEAVARMQLPVPRHPAAWEAVLQPLLAALPALVPQEAPCSYLPLSVGAAAVRGDAGELAGEFWSVASVANETPEATEQTVTADVVVYCPDGERVLAEFRRIRLVRLPGGTDGERLTQAATLAAEPPASEPSSARTSSAPAPVPASNAERQRESGELMVAHAAELLGLQPEQLDRRRTLRDLGLDSIAAARLRERLRRTAGISLPIARILSSESIGGLATAL